MLKIKSQSRWRPDDMLSHHKDFSNPDVRRLHATLIEFESWAKSARQKMDQLIDAERFDVDYSEAMQIVEYELGQLGLKSTT